jgi:hypothetical protein
VYCNPDGRIEESIDKQTQKKGQQRTQHVTATDLVVSHANHDARTASFLYKQASITWTMQTKVLYLHKYKYDLPGLALFIYVGKMLTIGVVRD